MIQRRELKYLIDEGVAEKVRMHIAGYCALDEHAGPEGRYVCDTLYLDTLQRALYRATIENQPRRHKLRIRRYANAPETVFLEVKRRVDDVIVKSRAAITGDWARMLEDGRILDAVPSSQRTAVENFLSYYETSYRGPLVPTVLVRYEREPYSSLVDPYVRVTMDRKLAFQPKAELSLEPEQRHWIPIDDPVAMRTPRLSTTVLELKFNDPEPKWLRDLTKAIELPRAAFCKYTRSVDALLIPPMRRWPLSSGR